MLSKSSISIFRKAGAFALACVCASAFAASKRETTMLPGTVKNFELPSFNETTGAKEWELFGDGATYVGDEQIDIDKMRLDLYEGAETPTLKAQIKSPLAHVNPLTKIVISNAAINVTGEDFILDGKKWKWDGNDKLIEIFSDLNIDVLKAAEKGEPEKTNIKSVYGSLSHGGKNNVFKLRENVRIVGTDLLIKCDYILLDSVRGGDIKSIEAEGNVKMLRDNRDAVAQKVVLLPQKGTAVLTGNPQITDLASRAELSGDKIVLDRENQKVEAFSGDKKRALTIFTDTSADREKDSKIRIEADFIEMFSKEDANIFNFNGNVKIVSEDFRASCDTLSAVAKNDEKSKPEVVAINGAGNVVLSNESGTATAKKMEIIPSKSEIWLSEGATLRDPDRGMKLESYVMVFERAKDRGIALAESENPDSFVVATIDESAEIASASSKKSGTEKSKTIVKSRRLNFSKDGEYMMFTFSRDVSIDSEKTNATCQKMDVLAKSDAKTGTQVKKIIASDDVHIKQSDYSATAELATIYPRLNVKGQDAKTHKFVELGIDPNSPDIRPSIILPPVGNLGFSDSASAAKAGLAPTVIKSDKQWLTSSEDADRYFFEGNVVATGTDMNANCSKIEVVMRRKKPDENPDITQIIMTGNVKLTQGLKDAVCGRADIYADEEMVVLSDSPVVINREDNTRATGHRIVYNKGKRGVMIESESSGSKQPSRSPSLSDYDEDAPPRPTITLPPIKAKD